MVRGEDLRGQREGLTDDVDGGSGGEQDTPGSMEAGPRTGDKTKEQTKALRDSAVPCMVVTALLFTFGALAAITIYVVTQAFGDDGSPPALASNVTLGQ